MKTWLLVLLSLIPLAPFALRALQRFVFLNFTATGRLVGRAWRDVEELARQIEREGTSLPTGIEPGDS